MKVKQILGITIPPAGNGLKSYDLFGIKKSRSIEIKKLLDKKNREFMKPVTDLINKLPKKATEENRAQIQEAMDGIVKWTAPRPFIETVLDIELKDVRECNYAVFAFTLEMFGRMQTNQNMAAELHNMLKTLETPQE